MGAGFLQGRRHAHNRGDIFRPGTPVMLLHSAFNQFGQRNAMPCIQHPDSLGPMKFVRGKGQQVVILAFIL